VVVEELNVDGDDVKGIVGQALAVLGDRGGKHVNESTGDSTVTDTKDLDVSVESLVAKHDSDSVIGTRGWSTFGSDVDLDEDLGSGAAFFRSPGVCHDLNKGIEGRTAGQRARRLRAGHGHSGEDLVLATGRVSGRRGLVVRVIVFVGGFGAKARPLRIIHLGWSRVWMWWRVMRWL
jgi:hypothetical protein